MRWFERDRRLYSSWTVTSNQNSSLWIPAAIEHVWNLNNIIPESSLVGQLLTTLFGYNSRPDLTEVIAYLGYFGFIIPALRPRRITRPAVAAG